MAIVCDATFPLMEKFFNPFLKVFPKIKKTQRFCEQIQSQLNRKLWYSPRLEVKDLYFLFYSKIARIERVWLYKNQD